MTHHRYALLLLLLHLLLRLLDPALQPAFVDESFHLERALVVWDFTEHPATFAHGKLLLYYYLGLWQNDELPVMLPAARMAIALWSCLTAVVIYRLGYDAGNRSSGLLALACYAVLPLALVHERMALADPFAAGFLALLIWQGLRFVQHPTDRRAIFCGLLLALTTLAKLTMGLAVVILPLLTVFASGGKLTIWWRRYARGVLLALLIALALWLPLLVSASLLEIEKAVLVNAPNVRQPDANFLVGLVLSLRLASEMLPDFISAAAFLLSVLLMGGLLQKHSRQAALMLTVWLSMGLLPLGAASFPAVRYFMPLAPALALLVGLAATVWFSRPVRIVLLAGVALWMLLFALPFTVTWLTRPTELDFHSALNFRTYQSGLYNAGAEIEQAAVIRERLSQTTALADWESCHLLRIASAMPVTCLSETNPADDLRGRLEQTPESSLLLISSRPFLWETIGIPYSLLAVIPVQGIDFYIHVVQLFPQRDG